MANWDIYTTKLNINGNTQVERDTKEIEDSIKANFQDSLSYRLAYFNSSATSIGVQIIDEDDLSEKKILMYPDLSLNIGDLINIESQNWMCISVNKTNPIYKNGIIKKCTHTLTVIKNTVSLEVPCIVSSKTSVETTEGTKYFPLAEGKISVIVSNNEDAGAITYNQVYKIGLNNYKVMHINDTDIVGLLALTMELTNDETVNSTPTPLSGLIITGDSTIMKNTTSSYTSNLACVWTLTNEDGSENIYATIITQTDTSITLTAGTILGENVLLKATSISDSEITTTKAIKIVGLF